MNKIDKTDTLKKILADRRFTVDYYQREYRWGRRQIEQMLDDLSSTFEEFYDPENHTSVQVVKEYGYYYMGSIICTTGKEVQIVDGQQRLTSLTLLLIYLNNLQNTLKDTSLIQVDFKNLIYTVDFGKPCFNLDVEERKDCFEVLLENRQDYLPENESNLTMLERYRDIEELFPEWLKGEVLPFFIYWLIEKVLLLEIDTPSADEAHTIFLTMNDRGLSLNSAEMMKAFLIQQVQESDRKQANEIWQSNINKIKSASPDDKSGEVVSEDVEFISLWLRAKYANSLRDSKKGAQDKDYELLGDKFHTWVRQNAKSSMGLLFFDDYYNFITKEMKFVTNLYLRLLHYSKHQTKSFEAMFYNANRDLNYQLMLIISGVRTDDSPETVNKKIQVISTFVDIFASVRIFNYKKVNWNTNKTFLFRVMTEIRNMDLKNLGIYLTKILLKMDEKLQGLVHFELNQYTGRYMLHMLARMVSHINTKMGYPSNFNTYIDRKSKTPYDIEHILPDNFEDYKNLFIDEEDFQNNRRKFGNLLILTRDKNRSYQAMTYMEKIKRYMGDNIIAMSLNEGAYTNNPQFLKWVDRYGFEPIAVFNKNGIASRTKLYYTIATDIWNPITIKELVGGWEIEEEETIVVESFGKRFTVEYAERSWVDAAKLGFLSANIGGSGKTIKNISVGDMVFCHTAGKGFTGVGICTSSALPMKEFTVMIDNVQLSITEVPWGETDLKAKCDPQDELFIGVQWIRTVESIKDGIWEKGMTSVPTVAYEVNDNTHDKVLSIMGIAEADTTAR